MNIQLIQDLRYKLQKRVQRLKSVDYQHYHATLKRFWNFLHQQEIFLGILDELKTFYRKHAILIERGSYNQDNVNTNLNNINTEDELAAVAYYLIQHCVKSNDSQVELNIGVSLKRAANGQSYEYVTAFHSLLVEPLYEYIDECLDDQRVILSLLRRYKHKCEWFKRDELFNIWEEDTRKGEKKLVWNLYEYLYDQGVDFSIEPTSVSGEIDLIALQNTDDRLLADAKIFNPNSSKGKSYIAKGLNQIYIYTQDYNEPFGYLVIFKTCLQDIRFALTNVDQSTPYIVHNNKTIFFLLIDIYPHDTSASKRGKLKTIEIDEKYLIAIIPQIKYRKRN